MTVESIKNHLSGVILTPAEANELHEAIALCTRVEGPPAPRWIQLPAVKDMPMVRIGRRQGSRAITLHLDGIEFPWHFISVQPGKLAFGEAPSVLLEISALSITHNDQMLLPKDLS